LAAGMTPVVSYWSSEDMLWLDGAVAEPQYPFLDDVSMNGNSDSSKRPRRKISGCKKDTPDACGEKFKMYNFAIEKISREHATVVQMQQSMDAELSRESRENGQQVNNLTLLGAPASVGVAQGVNPSEATEGRCAQAWQQCNGGPGWVGPKCCEDGCSCLSMDDGFSQCKPVEGRVGCGSSGNADFLVQRFEGEEKPRHGMVGGRLPWKGETMLGTSILTALTVCGLLSCVAARVWHHYLPGTGRRQHSEMSHRILMVRPLRRQPASYEAMRGNAEGHGTNCEQGSLVAK